MDGHRLPAHLLGEVQADEQVRVACIGGGRMQQAEASVLAQLRHAFPRQLHLLAA